MTIGRMDGIAECVPPILLRAWLQGRSLARGLPQPIAEFGGYRVETGTVSEVRRWVFAAPCPGLERLGAAIRAPLQPIKLCGADVVLRAMLSSRWQLGSQAFFMACDPATYLAPILPPGYVVQVKREGSVLRAHVTDAEGTLAASGYAAETAAAFVYDRIVTEPAHRRRGLGRAVMALLDGARTDRAVPALLVATGEGRCLYETLGWRILSPYSTAVISAA